MFLVVGVSMINKLRLRMLGVDYECVCTCILCVAYLSVHVCLCVCECVFLWYHRVVFALITISLVFFIHEIYFRVTSPNPFWYQSLNS